MLAFHICPIQRFLIFGHKVRHGYVCSPCPAPGPGHYTTIIDGNQADTTNLWRETSATRSRHAEACFGSGCGKLRGAQCKDKECVCGENERAFKGKCLEKSVYGNYKTCKTSGKSAQGTLNPIYISKGWRYTN